MLELAGLTFGKNIVCAHAGYRKHGHQMWIIQCVCGYRRDSADNNIISGRTMSCRRCFRFECGDRKARHGALRPNSDKAREYRIWCAMKSRCSNPDKPLYRNYAGRGIKVCQRWMDCFENFYEDMGPCPSSKHSIDRINVHGDYEKSNCRWATKLVQANNTRTNVFLDDEGVKITIADYARKHQISPNKIYKLVRRHGPKNAVQILKNK